MSNELNNRLGEDGAFVIGPARCGSTLVSDILNLHHDILSISEFIASNGLDSLLRGKVTGASYWNRLSKASPILRMMITPETMPNEFLYRSDTGRFPIHNVPPILKMTLPHLSNNPDNLFDSLSNTIPNQPKQSTQAHHAMFFQTGLIGLSLYLMVFIRVSLMNFNFQKLRLSQSNYHHVEIWFYQLEKVASQ